MPNKLQYNLKGDKDLIAKLNKLPEAVGGKALGQAALAGGMPILNAAKDKAPKKTRTLSRSLHEELTESTPTRAVVEIGTDLEYAAIHEFGGVIKPKNAKNLAIPLTSAARSVSSPRDMTGLKFIKAGSTKLLVDAEGEAQFVLKDAVTIPARPYLRPAFDEKQTEAQRDLAEALATLIDKAAK